MKKIIAAFDGLHFSQETLEQAIALSQHHNAHLVGVFLPEYIHAPFSLFEAVLMEGATAKSGAVYTGGGEGPQSLDESVSVFEQACRRAGLDHSIHVQKYAALKELVHESIFADLILLDRHDTFSSVDENVPGYFLRNLLHEVQCPVWLASKRAADIEKLIFLYNGEPASVFAMKQFAYLFPEMADRQVEVIALRSNSWNLHLPENKLLKEWMKRHFQDVSYKTIRGYHDELITLLNEETAPFLLTTGAYKRSMASMWLQPSFADELIRRVKASLFIVHT